eukprot:gnl/Chilomastix_cuspidata/2369.p1 GENE.gnl/Chilomastix_cuspidata/2369~~gnl/Chilomastix_cuspidata/2369.p1  ORF type:complete len:629 (+),score=344.41 gnl/Chilomastix_cuspidata/2369:1944-3830(+)
MNSSFGDLLARLDHKTSEKSMEASTSIQQLAGEFITKDKEGDLLMLMTALINYMGKAITENANLRGLYTMSLVLMLTMTSRPREEVWQKSVDMIDIIFEKSSDKNINIRMAAIESLWNLLRDGARLDGLFERSLRTIVHSVSHKKKEVSVYALNLNGQLMSLAISKDGFFQEQVFVRVFKEFALSPYPSVQKLILTWVEYLIDHPVRQGHEIFHELVPGVFNIVESPSPSASKRGEVVIQKLIDSSCEDRARISFDLLIPIILRALRPGERHARTVAFCLQWLNKLIHFTQPENWILVLKSLFRLVGEGGAFADGAAETLRIYSGPIKARLRAESQTFEKFTGLLVDGLLDVLRAAAPWARERALEWLLDLARINETEALTRRILCGVQEHFFREAGDAEFDACVTILCELLRRHRGGGDAAQWFRQITEPIFARCDDYHAAVARLMPFLKRVARECGGEWAIVRASACVDGLACAGEQRALLSDAVSRVFFTAPEFADIRFELTTGDRAAASRERLMRCFEFSPFARVAFHMVGRKYDAALAIFEECVARSKPSVELFTSLDNLITLFESAAFAHVRLDLSRPREHWALYRLLFGVLSVVPQCKAFQTLAARLQAMAPLLAAEMHPQ